MTDKSPTPPDRPDPRLDPTDDTDEPAFDWMKPAPKAKSAAGPAAGTAAPLDASTPSQPESRADRKAAEAAAMGQPDPGKADPGNADPGQSVSGHSDAAHPDAAHPAAALPGASAEAPPHTASDEPPLASALQSPPQEDAERRNAERRNAEREQAAKAKPVLPRVMQVLLAVFYPIILLVLAVRAVTSPLFLWVEYNRPGFPGDGYGFNADDRMTYGSYAVDYLSNWSGPRYLGDLVDQSGDRLFKAGEVSHMADVKAVILSTFGAGTLLLLLGLVAVIYLKRKHRGGVRRGLFAGSIITLAVIIGLGTLAVLGWEQFFTDFHHIFFANGTWTFTLQDTLIRLFPSQFWMDAGIVIGALVLLASVLTLILTWPTRRRRGVGKKADTSKDATADAGTDTTAEAVPEAAGSTGADAEDSARTRHTV